MSERHSYPSSQIMQLSSGSEPSPYTDNKSDTSRDRNGKRSRDDFQEDQSGAPRKIARLDAGYHSERAESQQPPNPTANTSNPNREQEFVNGPGHIVFIDEEGKRCPAICFNKTLLNTFNLIAVMSREIRERGGAIQEAQLELQKIKTSNQLAGLEEAKRKVEEAMKIQEDVEAEIPELIEAKRRCEALAEEQNWSKLKLDNSREVARFVIEQILNRENLLNTPSSKAQEPVKETKDHSFKPAPVTEKTLEDTQMSNGPESSLATSTTKLQSPTNTEERVSPRQLALRHFRWAEEELEYSHRRFTFMQEEYGHVVAANRRYHREQYPDRPASTTQTDDDLEGLQKKQRATGELIEAEEAYHRAEQHAEALGLGDILADPHACYVGEYYNEFAPPNPKSPSMIPVDRSRIEAWMASVPHSAAVDPQRREDAGLIGGDDWEAKSVEMFDSVSVAAYDISRKKIDKWQEISGRCRGEGGAEGWLPGNVRRNPRRRCRGRKSSSGGRRTRS